MNWGYLNSLKFREIKWNSTDLKGIERNSREFTKIKENLTLFIQIQCYSRDFYIIESNSKELLYLQVKNEKKIDIYFSHFLNHLSAQKILRLILYKIFDDKYNSSINHLIFSRGRNLYHLERIWNKINGLFKRTAIKIKFRWGVKTLLLKSYNTKKSCFQFFFFIYLIIFL